MSLGYNADTTMSKTVEGADCLIIAVPHDRFTRLNLKRIQILMKKPAAIVDMVQLVNPVKVEQMGFVYRGFGRGVWTK
jgi:UDP-N-acetyl-D-mannosaminuronate dehydrogenase